MARPKGSDGGVNKTRLVEEAIQALGDAPPRELRQYIMDKHGVDISPTMLSSYKSNILKKQGGGGGGGGGAGAGGRKGATGNATVGVRDLAALRDLIDRVGAPELQTLIKVLSR
jgi:hypothetical protein